ncbi:outer membrane protein transport protein [Enterobacter hormaechei]|uniref:outer membrane protein transport protein n=1 Tax=Enterobacter hormaechei TaxID=158836 RepID=UPI000C1EE38F|nr:outer membrane protein transport protein [Enterobacter hormaechei]MCF2195860.1 outer membrane protein transport protein [Enterobacter hormaechei]MDF3632441.1 outer membrane protein transport protein [Enterobacter hormaechei]MEA3626249.1 outer membrane protein transport protein [Enterobacter hormaechei]PJD91942.1 hypothetical protein B9Q35_01505 [Enterobacter hormaechei]
MKTRLLLCAGVLAVSSAHASALYFYEAGTEDTALAGAGQAARAKDASTIMTNPAGMTRLPDHMVTGGLQVMDGSIDNQLDNDAHQSPGDVMKTIPNASAFYSQKINDDLYAGIGLYGNYGLGIDYGSWAGDRLIKKSTMVAMTLSRETLNKIILKETTLKKAQQAGEVTIVGNAAKVNEMLRCMESFSFWFPVVTP